MQLTQRTRRRVLQAVLPMIVVVWAGLPWLPCCQGLPTHLAADRSGAGHAAHARSDIVGSAQKHATPTTAHAHHAPASVLAETAAAGAERDVLSCEPEDSAPLCADVVKNHTDSRPATAAPGAVALSGPTLILPVLRSTVGIAHAIDEPPQRIKRRPLHLAKSVLLI